MILKFYKWLISKLFDNDTMGTDRLSDKQVIDSYYQAGLVFGEIVSYIGVGTDPSLKEREDCFSFWEDEYVQRGFQPLHIDEFVLAGGWGKDITGLLGQRDKSK